MNLDPRLGSVDRIGSVVIGIGVMSYALLGGLDQSWIRFVAVALGLALVVGGIGGT